MYRPAASSYAARKPAHCAEKDACCAACAAASAARSRACASASAAAQRAASPARTAASCATAAPASAYLPCPSQPKRYSSRMVRYASTRGSTVGHGAPSSSTCGRVACACASAATGSSPPAATGPYACTSAACAAATSPSSGGWGVGTVGCPGACPPSSSCGGRLGARAARRASIVTSIVAVAEVGWTKQQAGMTSRTPQRVTITMRSTLLVSGVGQTATLRTVDPVTAHAFALHSRLRITLSLIERPRTVVIEQHSTTERQATLPVRNPAPPRYLTLGGHQLLQQIWRPPHPLRSPPKTAPRSAECWRVTLLIPTRDAVLAAFHGTTATETHHRRPAPTSRTTARSCLTSTARW